MHFIIYDKKDLAKKVALNVRAVDKNDLVSSLSNIKLEVCGSKLILTSFDGYNCAVSTIDIENVDGEDKSILIDSNDFKKVVDRLTLVESQSMEFKLLKDTCQMSIHSKRTKLKLEVILEVDDFETVPTLKEFESTNSLVFNKNDLIRAVKNVSKCSSQDNTKPILEAINFIVENNNCDIVSLDGYRLALNTLECKSDNNFKISVSAKKIETILKDISNNIEDEIEIKSNGKYTLIQSGDISIFISEIEGNLPPYKSLLNKDAEYELLLDTQEILMILNTSFMTTGKYNNIIKFTINPEKSIIEFNSKGSKISDCTDEMDVSIIKTNQDNLEIGFNSKYLIDLVGNIDSQNLKMYLKNSVSPVFIEAENNDNCTYLVLPVRLNVR